MVPSAGLVYLPPYSPDFNPLELVFAKFKWLLRSQAARTREGLWQLCGVCERLPSLRVHATLIREAL